MKRSWIAIAAILILGSPLFAQAPAKKVILRWGSVHTPVSITTQLMNRIIKDVNSGTQGRVEIQGYPGGALGGSRDLVEGIQSGMLEMTTEGPAQFGAWIPMVTIAEAQYIWRDVTHLNHALNGPFGEMLNEQFLAKGVRILGAIYYGTRQLTTTKTPIYSVADMKGKKIRVPETDLYLEMIKSWGAKPTPMTFNELYLALQQNVVDGQENPLTTFDGSKFYEVQKYIILTDHIICPNLVMVNENAWQKISPQDQKTFKEAVASGIAWHDAEVLRMEEELKKSLIAKGVKVITPDVESFRKATIPWMVPLFEKKWGKGTWDFVQSIK